MNLGEVELSVFEALNDYAVEYLVVGGCAMQSLGMERDTADVDVLISHSEMNVQRLCDALEKLGERPRHPENLIKPHQELNLFRYPFEIFTSMDGVDFLQGFGRHTVETQNGIQIRVMSAADLLTIKQESRDKALRRVQKEERDIAFIKERCV